MCKYESSSVQSQNHQAYFLYSSSLSIANICKVQRSTAACCIVGQTFPDEECTILADIVTLEIVRRYNLATSWVFQSHT